ncbi:STAS domain-containing protein [Streptomyces sp. NPDC057684]|uniref:STAS domain-containing protein n=1 Tax=Streptomyces sp. NPDC057684 TaxID=3346211 RepID=UPI0036C3C270
MCDQGFAGPYESVVCHVTNGWTVVEANEEIDIAFAPVVRAAVVQGLAEGHRHFVLDLCHTPFLDSMGLGMIVAVAKHIKARHGSLRIACSSEWLLHVFSLGGLRHAYSFHDSVEQAIAQPPVRSGLPVGLAGATEGPPAQ